VGILFWLSSQIIVVLLILLVAALLAYAVVAVIDLLHRFIPRFLAMTLVYLVAIAAFAFLAYITVKTLIPQLNTLVQNVQTFVTPGSNGQQSPLDQSLQSLGFTQSQINSAAKQFQSQLSSSAAALAKGTEQFIGSFISAGFNILISEGFYAVPNARLTPGSMQYNRIMALTMMDTDTSCQLDAPSIERKPRMSSKIVTITRNSQACGSTRQSACTSQMYIQSMIAHISAYQKLK
jgi:AI-2E family transporter